MYIGRHNYAKTSAYQAKPLHHKSISNLLTKVLKYNDYYFEELCKLFITYTKAILTVQAVYKTYLKMERLPKGVNAFIVVSNSKYIYNIFLK